MSEIIIPGRTEPTEDAKKYKKDCTDFEKMFDGTKTGDYRYCKYSLECHQIDYDVDGNPVNMEAHYLPIADAITGEILEHQLFCTGMIDKRSRNERAEDDKVS
jgi:hypothetical protein